MPKHPPPPPRHVLVARIATPRGASPLRSALHQLLDSMKPPAATEPRALATLATGEDARVWIGRRPEGWVEVRPSRRGGPVGRYFALGARLAAGAVEAFRALGDELSAHGAPRALLHEVDRAVVDQAKHARVLTSLARRFGGVVREPRLRRRAQRSLLELSLNNATEGCVRQTFGALIAFHQARMTSDASVAVIMKHVADDEVRHASLAFWVDHWAAARLDEDARTTIERAKHAALRQLHEEASHEPEPELLAIAGLPRRAEAVLLLRGLRERLFDS